MRLIDADAGLQGMQTGEIPYSDDTRYAILNAPTVDAVPVVRCEKCIFRNDHRCMRHRIDILNLDFFCSDGYKWSEDIEK